MSQKLTTLTPKMQAFVREYVIDHNGAAAARRAKYSEHTAREIAYQLLQRTDVQAAIREHEEADERMCGSQRRYVLNALKEVADRSRQAEPVRDGKGRKTGVYKFDGAVAVRALELLGKQEGLFSERLEVRVQGAIEELLDRVRPKMTQAAYAELVRAIAEISGIDSVAATPAEGDIDSATTH